MELLKVFQIYGGHLVKFRTNVVSIFKETKLFHNIIENYGVLIRSSLSKDLFRILKYRGEMVKL